MDASAYYTRELMRERLGVKALEYWAGTVLAKQAAELSEMAEQYGDLPLFAVPDPAWERIAEIVEELRDTPGERLEGEGDLPLFADQ
jgi:hypothetical protein